MGLCGVTGEFKSYFRGIKTGEKYGAPRKITRRRLALRAVAEATLSSLVLAEKSNFSEAVPLLVFGGNMVHPGRFELPTARFVAEYSIQLSYGCILNGGEAGIRTPDAAFDRILP